MTSSESPGRTEKKVMVSGCFDLLHAGHIRFLESASEYGSVHVCLGTDANVRLLKGQSPRFNQDERLYMLRSLKFVHHARLSTGKGVTDFEPDLVELKPDYFVVNHDGSTPDKERICEQHGVEYIVLPRTPKEGLPARSSSGIKKSMQLPYRLCLAGGWMDQPFVSQHAPGSVVVAQIEPTLEFTLRSGMATSTRQHWERLMPYNPDNVDPEKLAKLLFGYENPPGTKYVAGSQDAIGLTHPGINRLDYDGDYWPQHIERCLAPDVCQWLEDSLVLIPLAERPPGYDPLLEQNLTSQSVRRLGMAGEQCFDAILRKDLSAFGRSLTETHDCWRELLPLTTNAQIDQELNRYNDLGYGRTTSGCGGGYIFVATQDDLPNGFRVAVLR